MACAGSWETREAKVPMGGTYPAGGMKSGLKKAASARLKGKEKGIPGRVPGMAEDGKMCTSGVRRGRRKSTKVVCMRLFPESRLRKEGTSMGMWTLGLRRVQAASRTGGCPAEGQDEGLESAVYILHSVVLGRCTSLGSQRNRTDRMCVYVCKIILRNWLTHLWGLASPQICNWQAGSPGGPMCGSSLSLEA